MNFFPNFPNGNMAIPFNNGMMMPDNMNMNNFFNKFSEIENRIKKLEQRIIRLENEGNKNDFNYNEPDNSLYMI